MREETKRELLWFTQRCPFAWAWILSIKKGHTKMEIPNVETNKEKLNTICSEFDKLVGRTSQAIELTKRFYDRYLNGTLGADGIEGINSQIRKYDSATNAREALLQDIIPLLKDYLEKAQSIVNDIEGKQSNKSSEELKKAI